MTDQNNQEPTMEEILASIRRIISEDDAPAAASDEAAPHGDVMTDVLADEKPEPLAAAPGADSVAAPEPAPRPQPTVAAAPEPEPEREQVLELTDRVDEPAAAAPMQSMGDLDVFPAAPGRPAPAPAPTPAFTAPAAPEPDDRLITGATAASAASAFAVLSQTIGMPRDGTTLDDVVRELLKPLLKDWLDQNLPRIVENTVQAEVERIARRHS